MAVKPENVQMFTTVPRTVREGLKKLADYDKKTLTKFLQDEYNRILRDRSLLLEDDDY